MSASAPGFSQASRLKQTLAEATARIEEIIDAAERAAEGIHAEAQEEAEGYLADRRREADRLTEERARELSALTESLMESARQVREQVDGLVERIGEMDRTLAALGTSSATGESPASSSGPGSPAPESFEAKGVPGPVAYGMDDTGVTGGAEDEGADSSLHEEALLRATQMAVAGKGRIEIETALRTELQIDDPKAVIDVILGSEAA